jgi:hypothetical protein
MTTQTKEAPLGGYRPRRERDMHDVQNDYWSAKTGRFISVAQVVRLRERFRREAKIAKWEKNNRLVPFRGRMCLAYKVPGTAEAGQAHMNRAECERFIAHMLNVPVALKPGTLEVVVGGRD